MQRRVATLARHGAPAPSLAAPAPAEAPPALAIATAAPAGGGAGTCAPASAARQSALGTCPRASGRLILRRGSTTHRHTALALACQARGGTAARCRGGRCVQVNEPAALPAHEGRGQHGQQLLHPMPTPTPRQPQCHMRLAASGERFVGCDAGASRNRRRCCSSLTHQATRRRSGTVRRGGAERVGPYAAAARRRSASPTLAVSRSLQSRPPRCSRGHVPPPPAWRAAVRWRRRQAAR